MQYIKTYDKRRSMLFGLPEKYGSRVSYSIFICELNEREKDNMLHITRDAN